MVNLLLGLAIASLTCRVARWPDSVRIFYADHWYALVIPVTLFRAVFFLPAWVVIVAIAIVNTIPMHIELIRRGN